MTHRAGDVLMKMQFKLDMSDITYSDMSRAGVLTNKLNFINLDPNLAPITDESLLPPGDFDYSPPALFIKKSTIPDSCAKIL